MAWLFRIFRDYPEARFNLTQLWFRLTLSIASIAMGLIAYPLMLLDILITGEPSASFEDVALGIELTAILWGIGSYAGMTLATYIFGLKKEDMWGNI
jgi:hypothetical protein